MGRVKSRALIVSLVVGLINGLIWIFLVPPWQHYDEPNHFEYAWLIASRGVQPKVGDFDQEMRRAVATSMVNHGFFDHTDMVPDLTVTDRPIWIGTYSQLSDPPVYYWLVSLPLRIQWGQSIETQLYTARVVSLLLYLITILAAWGVALEITPDGHPVRLLLPISTALLPSVSDLMTAVNSDVASVAAFSIFIWACVRLIRRGPSLGALSVAVASAGLGIFIKEINFLALPLLAVAGLFAFLRGRLAKTAWVLLVLAMLSAMGAVLDWGDAALWGRWLLQEQPTRQEYPGAPLGDYVLRLNPLPIEHPWRRAQLDQVLAPEDAQYMGGQPVTVGAWMWASQPILVDAPILHIYEGTQEFSRKVSLGIEPTFYAYTATIQAPSARAWVTLAPGKPVQGDNVTIYYDGIVLAEGIRPVDAPPLFDDILGDGGQWGGLPFSNLIRNGSAERGGPFMRGWVDRLGLRFLPDQTLPSWIVYFVLDRPAAGWFHEMSLAHLFRSFWGLFGWGHVPLIGDRPYRLMVFVTGFLAIGVGIAVWRRRKSTQKPVYIFLLLVAALVWGFTFLRVANYILYRPYFPVARYTFPALIPVVSLILAGWEGFFHGLRRLRLPEWVWPVFVLVGIVALDIWGILSIAAFYGLLV